MSSGNGIPRKWTVADSSETYGIKSWSQGYFSINDVGHVVCHPQGPEAGTIDLKELVDEVRAPRHRPAAAHPLLGHPPGTASSQLNEAFRQAIAEYGYKGELPRRLPDQGEPAPLRGGGDRRVRQPVPLRPRGGLEARAARRDGAAGRRGRADHLQRLQGRGVHRDRAPRARSSAARSSWWSRSPRELPLIAAGRAEDRRRARASACASSSSAKRRGQVGGLGRRPLQVRPLRVAS